MLIYRLAAALRRRVDAGGYERDGARIHHMNDAVETVRGRNGGLRLGKAPSQIVVGAVVRKIEPDFAVVACENPEGYCRIATCCTLRSAMREAVHAFLEKLDAYTLEDLLRPKTKLRHLLGVN